MREKGKESGRTDKTKREKTEDISNTKRTMQRRNEERRGERT